jgi:catechol 2,3-dioxygenase-like lactoylglutathione lyase family enzyme
MNIKKISSVLFLLLFSFTASYGQLSYDKKYISIGVVVEDIDASLKFYTESLGMIRTGGFTVTGETSKRTGLSDGIPFDVVVLKLDDDPNAAEWKLLSFNKKATHPNQKFIQDDNGMQYITLFVKALNPFVERLNKNKIKLLGKTPTKLNDGRYFVLVQDPDGTFIELIGPME